MITKFKCTFYFNLKNIEKLTNWPTSGQILRHKTFKTKRFQLLTIKNHILISLSHVRSVPADRITYATDCRSSIQNSIIALKAAQEALPQLEINHITQRQITAVMHANEYLLTDMADEDRYQHTSNVLNVYYENVEAAVLWQHNSFLASIKRKLDEAENAVLTTARLLREYRVEYIEQMSTNKHYIPGHRSDV